MTSMNCVLIGGGSVLARCAEALLAKGHRVVAVVTADATARSWAVKAGVAHHGLAEAVALAPRLSCDLLLSAGNYAVVPDALLACARRAAVNYHYGPLPQYSGLHTPSWAIADGAREYGITWHRMDTVVDGGAVLGRVPVAIEPEDTALSLGLRCDEAAVASVGALIDQIAEGRETATPQDPATRRYFSRHTQFPAEGLIDWHAPAERVAALVRATDHGPFASPLVWPKVDLGGHFYAVREAVPQAADATTAEDPAAPGTVLACDAASGLRVATGAGTVALTRLCTLEGEERSADALAATHGIRPGTVLAVPGEDAAARLTRAGTDASKSAARWRAQLIEAGDHPYRLPHPQPGHGSPAAPVTVRCPVPGPATDRDTAAYLAGALGLFLGRASGREEVHLAMAAPREGVDPAHRDLFAAWLPLPCRIDAGATVAENLRAVREEFTRGQDRGWIRRDAVGRDEALRERWNRGALTPDVLISWGPRDTGDDRPGDTGGDRPRDTGGDRPRGATGAQDAHGPRLALHIEPASGTRDARVTFHPDPARLAAPDVARLADQFAAWCGRLRTAAERLPAAVDLLTAPERAALVGQHHTDPAGVPVPGLHRLFEATVREHADATAVICGDTGTPYAELNARANRLAHALVGRGVGRGDLVGVALGRSTELVVALLAVLKTGAAYVPVDPGFPAERVHHMIEDADPVLVITSAEVPPVLAVWESRCVSVHLGDGTDADGDLAVDTDPGDLAYVLYTSGSTGRPKGVEITHGAVGAFLTAMRGRPGCTAADRLLAITTVSFDISVLELFLPLVCGATTVVARSGETVDARALRELMERHRITLMQGTPSTWRLLLDGGWRGTPTLTKVLCGGEALPRDLADRLLAAVGEGSVWNMYGPTETTVWSTAWEVAARSEEDGVLIGTPIDGTQVYVLGADLAPVPPGFPGELCVGGAGVARGYRGDPARTGHRFPDNPFHPGALYRTGDLAVSDGPGRLRLLGRDDRQIKLRGHRVELADVEAAVTRHEAVRRAVVVGRDDRLIAYCVREPAPAADPVPSPAGHGTALAEWAAAWDRAYEAGPGPGADDPGFNLAGWRTSYDGLPFSDGEMRDWQRSSVRRILSHAPEDVFEIGSGSGLMLFGLAPHCRTYHAVDASAAAVETTRRHLAGLPQVRCEQRAAHELPEVAEGAYDTVVINSVAQYFPGADYLTSVLEWATRAVTRGRVFLGDVRDLSLLDVFHADVADFRAAGEGGGISAEELARRTERGARAERELLLGHAYFAALPTRFPQISRVDITLRDGHYVNEMTRYRYDVTLHIGEDAPPAVPAEERDWPVDGLDPAALGAELDAIADRPLRLNGVPNGRLAGVCGRVAPALDFLGALTSAVPPAWTDPADLTASAGAAGLEVALLPSRSGDPWRCDALFWRPGVRPDLGVPPAVTGPHANTPAVGAPDRPPLHRLLRPWLAERLPEYMVPAFVVELDAIPLTPNGKTDESALPDPVREIDAAARPATELERDITAIWADVLGHDRIGVDESFFEIGGTSLRVVRVQTRLEELVGRPLPAAKLFEHFTVRTLAAYLAGDTAPRPEPVPASPRADRDEPIAVIGMACRLPGDVSTPEEYWELLERGGDGIVDIPKDRWDAEALYDPDPETPGTSYCRRGGFVRSIDLFDAPFFGISPREARALDPMQRMVLETTWEAFERAGYTLDQLRGSRTGTFIGIGKSSAWREYGLTTSGGLSDLDGYVGPGSMGGTMSGRVSYILGLEGPALTVDTACSSSLVTTHLACNALRAGECDLAVSAGVSLLLTPELHVEFSRLRGMSVDGRCRSFSSDTDGTGWSEGSATVVLKRLSDARRDGDPVLAVLRGTAVNHDGHSASLTTPSGPAQQRVVRAALAASGLRPDDIDYLEAHGTGTKLGDPIEGTALAEVFGGSHPPQAPLWVGSAKSNLGHTQAAAGLAGLLKVVLALRHATLPRTLHIAEPTPAVDWKGAGMALVQEQRPWPVTDVPRRAGVSSFGIGGTNAHVIVEEPPRPPAPDAGEAASPVLPPALPFLVSGHDEAALRGQAEKLRLHLDTHPGDPLIDVARSLATTRSRFRRRLVLSATDRTELQAQLASFARTGEPPAGAAVTGDPTGEPRLALLFTGQGSQLPGMGRDLYDVHPVFRTALEEVAARFTGLDRPLLDVLWADPDSADAALLHRTDLTQPALFALEVALWRLWESWGVRPRLLLGHSIGELAAAHVAGVFDLDDACRLVAARGALMRALPARGAMVSLEAGGEEAEAALDALGLRGRLDIAALNTPTQTVLSGDTDAVEAVAAHFAERGRGVKRLTVSHAFHSHHMDALLADFRAVADTVRFHPPRVPVVSGLTGEPAAPGELERPDYWVRQVRHTVRFADGLRALRHQGVDTFLELGPQPVLSAMGASFLADGEPVAFVPSCAPGEHGATVAGRSLAALHVRGVAVDWDAYFAPFGGTRVPLPTYAFQRERFWFEPPRSPAAATGLRPTGHPLLGGGVEIAGTGLSLFTGVLAADRPGWVGEHRVLDSVLLPGTAFLELARSAGDALGDGAWDVADMVFSWPLVIEPGTPVRTQVTVGPPAAGGARPVKVYSASEDAEGPWQLHVEGTLTPAVPVGAPGEGALTPAGAVGATGEGSLTLAGAVGAPPSGTPTPAALAAASASGAVTPTDPAAAPVEGALTPAGAVTAPVSGPLPPPGAEPLDVSALYRELDSAGYGFGPSFRSVREAWRAEGAVWARVALPEGEQPSAADYALHPALLDSAMQSLLMTHRLRNPGSTDVFVPFEAERLSVRVTGRAEVWVRVAAFEQADGEFWGSLDLYDGDGGPVGHLHRLHARRMDRAVLRRLAAPGVDRFRFDVDWRPADIADVELGGSWGLLTPAGDVPWARDVKTLLARSGIQLIRVEDLADADDLDGLVCLWDTDAGTDADADAGTETETETETATDVPGQAHAFTARGLELLQEAIGAEFRAPLVWVTRRAVGTGAGDQVSGPGAAPLWGLLRTARAEHPELSLRLVDIGEAEADRVALPAALMLEAEPECAVRAGEVLVPRLLRADQQEAAPAGEPFVRPDGAVLVSGGTGGLGRRVAGWLAGTHGVRDLVLVSRQGAESPGARDLVAELSALGAEVTVVEGDVADRADVARVMALFGEERPLRGVVHAAGVLDDGVLTDLTPERLDAVLRPKVDGLWQLHRQTLDADLDLFMMFSSVSGVLGTAGQGNYAAANAFMDAVAHRRRAAGLPATSVAYGPWEGTGMAAGLGASEQARLSRLGLDPLTPDEGLELLERAARGALPLTVAAALDLSRAQLSFADLGGVPPLFRALLDTGADPGSAPGGGTDLRKLLGETAPEDYPAVVLRTVRAEVAKTLGFTSPEAVGVDLPLRDIGFDSLSAVLMRNQLARLTGLALPARIAFDHPHLIALSDFLLAKLLDVGLDTASGPAPAAEPPGAAVPDLSAARQGFLHPDLRFDNAATAPDRPSAVFVTGATGFVGAHLLSELLAAGLEAHCLVRADDPQQAMKRLVTALDDYELWQPEFAPLLTPVVGDLTRPLFGLDEERFDALADQVDAVCHSAALLDWMRPLAEYVGPNMVGTHEALRLAARGRGKAFHFISTFATLPRYLGHPVTEDAPEYGYQTSKWQAELMVAAARWRGAKASTYRLPYVAASTRTGRFRLDRGDFLHNLVSGCLGMGGFPELATDLRAVLPVDYLCRTVAAAMISDPARIGRDHDFVNSGAPGFDRFFELAGGAAGGAEILPFDVWRLRALEFAAGHPASPLARIAALIDGLTAQGLVDMFAPLPVGDAVFGAEDYPSPPVDEAYVRTYVHRIHTSDRAEDTPS
ncbi:amino acid adenylation domain-containing protein [Streptomyces sp. NPDC048290]|uniref:amino acid adenylation domain-containing protein n=1 Tax=Streptomyces sp. NPDC048290 TaxID=3155811 RepID=UPI003412F477